ncbi:putative ABC transporter permease [Hespellia stercorisuis]|uniref:Uncharacterized membrane protein n=1 Tax=Hespellia stercorisuis DSM 15480 TaxID=1121950 RepID=A0A1M6R3N3_9FIRM|nr:Uncharacterized membrane protein [Hespellia stercorisuis DSM 15480]
MTFYDILLYFFIYGFFGWCCEVGYAAVKSGKFVNRGFLNGPICPIYGVGVTMVVFFLTPWRDNLILLYLTSVVLVTVLEGVTGYAMDKIFHNKWWDYSGQPLNIGGYVCLLFSLVWGVACVVIVDFVHPLFSKVLSYLPFAVGVILIVVLVALLVVDLYVTSASIVKMNKHLESMEKIAKELHEISDQIGEEIFTRVTATMEKQEDISEEMQGHIAELKEKYQELSSRGSRVSRRLVRAFPKMKPREHSEQFEKWRERLQKLQDMKANMKKERE